jgi:glycerophosphoryl diester phosphodiesterase
MTLIIAHRGASADAPENTLAAFRLAWEQGADAIEGDFMLSADGRIVCFHDLDTKRLTGAAHIVRDSSFQELQSLDVGLWKGAQWRGERIAALEDVLSLVPVGKRVVLELKSGPEIVEPLADVLEQASVAEESVLIISLVDVTVAACKRRLPNVRCHWLSGYERRSNGGWAPTAEEVIAAVRQLGADGFGSESKPEHFDAEFVARLRAAGIAEFHVWTVDDPAVARFYAGLGAWGITTNRPALIRAEMT